MKNIDDGMQDDSKDGLWQYNYKNKDKIKTHINKGMIPQRLHPFMIFFLKFKRNTNIHG